MGWPMEVTVTIIVLMVMLLLEGTRRAEVRVRSDRER
jgi:hypothetical protein